MIGDHQAETDRAGDVALEEARAGGRFLDSNRTPARPWNNALRHWKTSEVYLFNNLIPLSTMLWAHFTLGEPMTPTFWIAMALVAAGVLLGQAKWQALFAGRWFPAE